MTGSRAFGPDFRMGKQKLPRPRLCLNAQPAGSLLSDPERPRPAPRPHFLSRGHSPARVRKPPPPPTPPPCAARPAPPAGTWSSGTGAGTHAARPPCPPPANSPNSCGRSQGPRGGSARRSLQGPRHRGGAGGRSHCPLVPSPRGLLPRKNTETPKPGGLGLTRERWGAGGGFSRIRVPSPLETH